MTIRNLFLIIFFTLLGFVPLVALWLGQPFYLDIFTRILIFSIAAISLDFILGYGGMVSFGHAVYLGVGAYVVGILSFHGVTNGFVHLAVAIAACSLLSFFIGMVSLRTKGIHFIMITLAFAQMVYFLSISVNTYGGDDGLNIFEPSYFYELVDLTNPIALYYVCFIVLLLVLFLFLRVSNSHFGRVISGARSNERRMGALGFSVYRYKLTAFVLAAITCGLAGVLLANQVLYVSPAIMHWTRSGELMVIVILGGIASLYGAVIGATLYILLEHYLSNATEHWQIIMGPFLLLVILYANRGLLGLLWGKDALMRKSLRLNFLPNWRRSTGMKEGESHV